MEPPPRSEPERAARPSWWRGLWIILVPAALITLGVGLAIVLVWQRATAWYRESTSPAAIARANAANVMQVIRAYADSSGAPPPSLAALVPSYLTAIPSDGWRMPFVYTVDATGRATLVSYGADKEKGGRGADADLWWQWSPGGQVNEGIGEPPR